MAPLHGGSGAGKSDLRCGRSLNVVGRPGLHQSGLMSTCFADCPSPGPRKNDLTIYWILGPFVRSFTLPVDLGDICPPHHVCPMCGYHTWGSVGSNLGTCPYLLINIKRVHPIDNHRTHFNRINLRYLPFLP
jgi:hypothetical protein